MTSAAAVGRTRKYAKGRFSEPLHGTCRYASLMSHGKASVEQQLAGWLVRRLAIPRTMDVIAS